MQFQCACVRVRTFSSLPLSSDRAPRYSSLVSVRKQHRARDPCSCFRSLRSPFYRQGVPRARSKEFFFFFFFFFFLEPPQRKNGNWRMIFQWMNRQWAREPPGAQHFLFLTSFYLSWLLLKFYYSLKFIEKLSSLKYVCQCSILHACVSLLNGMNKNCYFLNLWIIYWLVLRWSSTLWLGARVTHKKIENNFHQIRFLFLQQKLKCGVWDVSDTRTGRSPVPSCARLALSTLLTSERRPPPPPPCPPPPPPPAAPPPPPPCTCVLWEVPLTSLALYAP